MTQIFHIHPDNPQERLLKQAVQLLDKGHVLAVPTDSSYALICHIDDKHAADTLRQIRGVDDKHPFTLLCRDLKEIATYAKVDNRQFKILKTGTPGAFTFILEATKEVPKRLSHPKRSTIGLRVPNHTVLQNLLALHGAPVLATTLIMPNETEALNDVDVMQTLLPKTVAAIIDAGTCALEVSTVIDLTNDTVEIRRYGAGDISILGL